jgi:hypothetical protein
VRKSKRTKNNYKLGKVLEKERKIFPLKKQTMNIFNILRKPYLAFFMASLVLLSSCNNNENLEETVISKEIIQTKVKDKNLINNFIELQKTSFKAKNSLNIKFNNNNILKVSLNKNAQPMIIANQKGFNIENNENYAISAAITEKGLSSPIIVKTTKTSNNIYKIDYFSKDMKPIYSLKLNPESESINSSIKYSRKIQIAPCGHRVAACLDDVYTNHGWISVWAFVQTAFIPATGAALAAACFVDECILN